MNFPVFRVFPYREQILTVLIIFFIFSHVIKITFINKQNPFEEFFKICQIWNDSHAKYKTIRNIDKTLNMFSYYNLKNSLVQEIK